MLRAEQVNLVCLLQIAERKKFDIPIVQIATGRPEKRLVSFISIGEGPPVDSEDGGGFWQCVGREGAGVLSRLASWFVAQHGVVILAIIDANRGNWKHDTHPFRRGDTLRLRRGIHSDMSANSSSDEPNARPEFLKPSAEVAAKIRPLSRDVFQGLLKRASSPVLQPHPKAK
jgi:hypothetical protein